MSVEQDTRFNEETLQAVAHVRDRTCLAIAMMCAVSLIFSFQDVFSRILGGGYPPVLIVMIRYWVFALFVIALVARQPGGLKRAIRTKRPLTQIARGVPTILPTGDRFNAEALWGLVERHRVSNMFTAPPFSSCWSRTLRSRAMTIPACATLSMPGRLCTAPTRSAR